MFLALTGLLLFVAGGARERGSRGSQPPGLDLRERERERETETETETEGERESGRERERGAPRRGPQGERQREQTALLCDCGVGVEVVNRQPCMAWLALERGGVLASRSVPPRVMSLASESERERVSVRESATR